MNVNLLGKDLIEISEVSYSTEREHQLNYSLGNDKATSYSMGKYSHSASLTLYMSEVVAVENAMGGDKDLTKIKPFQVTVTYADESGNVITDKLWVKFQSQGREVTGEMGLAKQFDMFAIDIKYNV
ncbi:hypothetical protein [Algivirga pacifica]|uniref:hypothetical protein n=1 Tax=Algivirga pacifica TaxID=1162670 RepID=UPI0031F0BA4A